MEGTGFVPADNGTVRDINEVPAACSQSSRFRCWTFRLMSRLSVWLHFSANQNPPTENEWNTRRQISDARNSSGVKLLPHLSSRLPERDPDDDHAGDQIDDVNQEQINLTANKLPTSVPSSQLQSRDTWSGKFQFFLSCMGYCVGFGNIWRFPFLVYRNGGGAFLIPYVIFLVLCGIPLVFMEMVLGQFSSLSPIHLFGKFSPLFKGIGYSMVTISFLVCIYYNTILSWVIYYLYSSFQSVLPWSICDPSWASERCFTRFSSHPSINSSFLNMSYKNVSSHFASDSSGDSSHVTFHDNRTQVVAAEEFWNRHVLRLSAGVDVLGSLRPELVVSLALAWLTVFLCSCKGQYGFISRMLGFIAIELVDSVVKCIQSSGKVVYVTATCPFIMLFILLARGCTLPGALDGIKLFIYPDFQRLANLHVWIDAAMQVFYAMAPGWGGLMSFASYNSFHVDVFKYGIAIPILNFLTSMLGGFAVFSIIGYLSYQSGLPVDQVIAHGPGLTFVAYPEALSQLPLAPVWSVLFFVTLFTIGIDSQFGMFETFISAMVDEFKILKKHRVWFCAGSCILLFFLGLICVTEAGMYWVQIIDWYCAFLTLLVICLIECFLVGWVYGTEQFEKDIELMIGYRIGCLWSFCWKYLTPVTIFILLICNLYLQTPIVYESYVFPVWSVGVGWVLAISSVLPIPFYALYVLCKRKRNHDDEHEVQIETGEKANLQILSIWSYLMRSVKATPEYGPVQTEDRIAYDSSKGTM